LLAHPSADGAPEAGSRAECLRAPEAGAVALVGRLLLGLVAILDVRWSAVAGDGGRVGGLVKLEVGLGVVGLGVWGGVLGVVLGHLAGGWGFECRQVQE